MSIASGRSTWSTPVTDMPRSAKAANQAPTPQPTSSTVPTSAISSSMGTTTPAEDVDISRLQSKNDGSYLLSGSRLDEITAARTGARTAPSRSVGRRVETSSEQQTPAAGTTSALTARTPSGAERP